MCVWLSWSRKVHSFIWTFLTNISLDTFRCQNEAELTFPPCSHIIITTTFQCLCTPLGYHTEGRNRTVEKVHAASGLSLASVCVLLTCTIIKANLTFYRKDQSHATFMFSNGLVSTHSTLTAVLGESVFQGKPSWCDLKSPGVGCLCQVTS